MSHEAYVATIEKAMDVTRADGLADMVLTIGRWTLEQTDNRNQLTAFAVDDVHQHGAGVFVDHMRLDLPPHVLVLRPGSLVTGMGCNRGTNVEEMRNLRVDSCTKNDLSISSLRTQATVDLKTDEPGLLALEDTLNVPTTVFTRGRLKTVEQVRTFWETIENLLDPTARANVDMQPTVFIGNSSTFDYNGFMITPRGYANKYDMG